MHPWMYSTNLSLPDVLQWSYRRLSKSASIPGYHQLLIDQMNAKGNTDLYSTCPACYCRLHAKFTQVCSLPEYIQESISSSIRMIIGSNRCPVRPLESSQPHPSTSCSMRGLCFLTVNWLRDAPRTIDLHSSRRYGYCRSPEQVTSRLSNSFAHILSKSIRIQEMFPSVYTRTWGSAVRNVSVSLTSSITPFSKSAE